MNTPHNAVIINERLAFHILARFFHYLKTLSVVHVVILGCCVLLGCCFMVANVVKLNYTLLCSVHAA